MEWQGRGHTTNYSNVSNVSLSKVVLTDKNVLYQKGRRGCSLFLPISPLYHHLFSMFSSIKLFRLDFHLHYISVSGWTKCKKGPTAAAILKIGSVWLEITSHHLNLLQKMVSSTHSSTFWALPKVICHPKATVPQRWNIEGQRWKKCGWCETHCSYWKLSYYVCSFSWNPETPCIDTTYDYKWARLHSSIHIATGLIHGSNKTMLLKSTLDSVKKIVKKI